MNEWTRLHLGQGGGAVTITQDDGGAWTILFTPKVGAPIVRRDDGPLGEAMRRADELVLGAGAHVCVRCPPW